MLSPFRSNHIIDCTLDVFQGNAIGLEPLESRKSATIYTVLFKLPCGEDGKPPDGLSGLAIGSTLISHGKENLCT